MPVRASKNLLYKTAYLIVFHPLIIINSLLMALLNTIILGLDRYPLSSKEEQKYEEILFILNFYFVCELLLKLLALGVRNLVRSKIFIIETAAVVLGLANFLLSELKINHSERLMTTVRSVMLLRIVKILMFFPSIQIVFKTIKQTLWKMADFSIVIGMFIFVSALFGMQLFAYSFYDTAPILNFDSFLDAFTAVFALLVGDNWNDYMHDAIKGTNSENARIFYFIVILIGYLFFQIFF